MIDRRWTYQLQRTYDVDTYPDQLPLPGQTENSFVLQYGIIVEKKDGHLRRGWPS